MKRTKRILQETLWELLEEKPYKKITVQDFADRCEINRNTFYYHFQDIPDLLETTVVGWADAMIEHTNDIDTLEDDIIYLCEGCISHKKALIHIYKSVHREIFMQQLDKICMYITTSYYEQRMHNITLSPSNQQLIIRYAKCIIMGVLLDWFDHNLDYDIISKVKTICSAHDLKNHPLLHNLASIEEGV